MSETGDFPDPDPDPDTLIAGRYRVHERLGTGGMGTVHRATDTRLKRQVALKRVLLRGLDEERRAEAGRRIRREAEIAARVHHPRIVSVFDVLDDPGGPILVLEYLPSRSLDVLLADAGVLAPAVAARAGAQLAEALATAHAAGIVHRDVKPGNVLVAQGDPMGPVKLTDFGISFVPDAATLTADGVGTPAYLAPEIARGERATPASDVYALGATLWAAVHGTPPYGHADGNPTTLIARIGREPVPAPPVGGPFGELLARMTAADPQRRPSAAEAAAALERLADRPGPDHPPPPVPAAPTLDPDPPGRRPRYRRRTLLAGAALVLAVVVAGGAVVATSGGGPSFPVAVPAVTAGDERTADPCSLVRPEALAQYGVPTVVPDYGNFANCYVGLPQDGGKPTTVNTRLRRQSFPPTGEKQQIGDVQLVRKPSSGSGCDRWIVLADGVTQIEITVDVDGDASRPPDPCEIAETAAASALTSLVDHNGVGRRAPPPFPLWAKDACTVLTPADLPFVAPEELADPDRGFAGWTCTWNDDQESGVKVTVTFDRYNVPQTDYRTVSVSPPVFVKNGTGTCDATVHRRPFQSTDGERRTEMVRVKLERTKPSATLCDLAAALATAASTRT